MVYSRKTQRLVYDPGRTRINNPPVWRVQGRKRAKEQMEAESSQRPPKRRTFTKDEKWNALFEQFRRHISQKIRSCYEKSEDIPTLKTHLSGLSQLPRGTVTSAERRLGTTSTSIQTLLRAANKKENTSSIARWRQFVNENFDDLDRSIRTSFQERTTRTAGPSTPFIPDSPAVEEESITITGHEPQYRTCSTGFNTLIRTDISASIKQAFCDRIEQATVDVSDYISKYSLQVYKTMLLFKSSSFVIQEDGRITLEQNTGRSIATILPPGFPLQTNATHVAPFVNPDYFANAAFADEFDKLFDNQHLESMHTFFFGAKGLTLGDPSMKNTLMSALPPARIEDRNVDSHFMKLARAKYKTNFQVMWSTTKRFYSLLNHLLIVLLRIHLAPQREANKRDRIQRRRETRNNTEAMRRNQPYQESIPFDRISVIEKSYNAKKRLFAKERKQREKYLTKAENDIDNATKWTTKARRCTERLETYETVLQAERNTRVRAPPLPQVADDDETDLAIEADTNPVAAQELMALEDTTRLTNGDIPSRRLNKIKAIVRQLKYSHVGGMVTEHNLRVKLSDATDHEARVCLLIANFILPYIPPRNRSFIVARQIPFMLMANDLLRYTGYTKFARKISPITKPTSLLTLQLDAPSIYALMCGPNIENVDVFDFDGMLIPSRQVATESKDAMYSSFFNIEKIYDTCDSYGLIFAQNMQVLPGRKTVRLGGYLKKPSTTQQPGRTVSGSTSTRSSRTLADEHEVQRRKAVLETEIAASKRQLEAANQELRTFYRENSISDLKMEWNHTRRKQQHQHLGDIVLTREQIAQNTMLHDAITTRKTTRNEIYTRILEAKENMVNSRQAIYRLTKDESEVEPIEQRRSITSDNYKCLGNVTEFSLDANYLNSGNLKFTGTDNGLVSLTDTVGFDLDRFQYHMDMFCANSAEERSNLPVVPAYLKMPPCFKVDGKELHYRSGTREYLERIQKTKLKERRIFEIEAQLSRSHLSDATTVEEVIAWQELHHNNANELRRFYNSPEKSKRRRTLEIRSSTVKDKTCSAERKYFMEDKNQKLIMFIGDQGLGVGSIVKGYNKYGGKWKPAIHSRYSTVFYTSEHNTSQTCPYCFRKLSNPIRVIERNHRRELKIDRGSFLCINTECPSVRGHQSTHGRDTLSALAIGLSGLSNGIC